MKYHQQLFFSLAIGIPLATLLYLFSITYIPRWLFQPTQSFVYQVGANYDETRMNNKYYVIVNHRIQLAELKPKEQTPLYPNENQIFKFEPEKDNRLFSYDPQKRLHRELSYEQAQQIQLDDDLLSDDGFTLKSGNHTYQLQMISSRATHQMSLSTLYKRYSNTEPLGWIK